VAVASAGPYANLHLDPDTYYASIPPLSFLQTGCPSCRPTNSIKAMKAGSEIQRKNLNGIMRRWNYRLENSNYWITDILAEALLITV